MKKIDTSSNRIVISYQKSQMTVDTSLVVDFQCELNSIFWFIGEVTREDEEVTSSSWPISVVIHRLNTNVLITYSKTY